jgi:hypothetical protein
MRFGHKVSEFNEAVEKLISEPALPPSCSFIRPGQQSARPLCFAHSIS